MAVTTLEEPVLQATGLRKSYGHVEALREGTLDLHAGEVVALVGDNGAGKSTMVGCLSGAVVPDDGLVLVNGEESKLGSIQAAMNAGIATVYQDLAMAPDLTVAENIFLSQEMMRRGLAGRLGLLDRRAMYVAAADLMSELGITTLPSVQTSVGQLSGGQRQVCAIARAVRRARRLVIMDEPTAALGARQAQVVIDTIRATTARGIAVLLVSHDLPRVLDLADRIAVMRFGRIVANVRPPGLRVTDIVALMLGESRDHGEVTAEVSSDEQ